MSSLDQLNPMQQEAVSCTEGPLLVLAGAGSGKTRVLAHRIAYLIEEKQVNPWNILAITFTNKAAGEMRERVNRQVRFGADGVWVSTFHSACARILRRYIEFLGYTAHFTIYDTDDQRLLLRQVYKALDIDDRFYRERQVLAQISSAKDRLVTPEQFIKDAGTDLHGRTTGEIYAEYQNRLKKNDALDFDDLLVKTVELFRQQPEVLDHYQERFRYIMVDEYQDTNRAQFEFLRLLAGKYKNLCVVGDDDQSIYRFRGADIGNILNFEDAFPGAAVVKLEQNYRSTQNILDAANAVIRNNRDRKEKTLWTANGAGEKLEYRQFDQAYEEADFIIRDILNRGYPYEDCAVLYRTNAQSRLLEEKCIACGVPYRLVGGVNFYQRKEIKDVLAYLKIIASGRDDVAAGRVINVPKRGIGAASLGKVTVFAAANDHTLYEAMERAEAVPGLGRAAASRIRKFTDLIGEFRRRLREGAAGQPTAGAAGERAEREEQRAAGEPAGEPAGRGGFPTAEMPAGAARTRGRYSIRQLIEDILDETGYRRELEAEGSDEADSRLENIEELVNKAVSYEEEADVPTLDGFLEEVALVADVDEMDQSERRVTLMTLHSAKGLEFENVYLSGMENGVFPSYMTVTSDDPSDIEEERRLCYVGITRAKRHLTLTGARTRMVNGQTRCSAPSCFLDEIPDELMTSSRLTSWLSSGRRKAGEGQGGQQIRWMDDTPEDGQAFWERNAADGCSEGTGGTEDPGDRHAKAPQEDPNAGRAGLSPRSARQAKPAGASLFSAGSKPDFGKPFPVTKSKTPAYKAGDRVKHVKFGDGTVLSVQERAKDYEVSVEFDSVGVRKILASFLKSKEAPPPSAP